MKNPGRTPFLLLGALVLAVGLAAPASSVVPGQLNYQGLLLDDVGDTVQGAVALDFALYDALTGGTQLWAESHPAVPVVDGVYDVVLGSTTPLTASLVSGGALFLEITVAGETLVPRQQLLSVPYALRSAVAETTLDVGGIPPAVVSEIWEHVNFDGGPPNDDPSEGLGDTDGDSIANFVDPDNDNDGLTDSDEVAQGTDINLVTPIVGGLSETLVEASATHQVTVTGSNFEPGMTVAWGTESPMPQSVTSTSFDVSVGPQPEATINPVVTLTNGQSDTGPAFQFVAFSPVIASIDPSQTFSTDPITVTVSGTGFASGLAVSFGSENPIPQNLTAESFDVTVGPQPPGIVNVTLSYPSGNQATSTFEWLDVAASRTVFVTSTRHAGEFGGLAGADAICAARASGAGLSGTYLAWVSDSTGSPSTRFSTGTDYRLVDGSPVATDFAALTSGPLSNAIRLDENGVDQFFASSTLYAWTGTNSDGTPAGSSCSDWTSDSSAQSAQRGAFAETDDFWSTQLLGSWSCADAFHLYCFEQ